MGRIGEREYIKSFDLVKDQFISVMKDLLIAIVRWPGVTHLDDMDQPLRITS